MRLQRYKLSRIDKLLQGLCDDMKQNNRQVYLGSLGQKNIAKLCRVGVIVSG